MKKSIPKSDAVLRNQGGLSMTELDLFDAFGGIDEDLLERPDQCDTIIHGKEPS